MSKYIIRNNVPLLDEHTLLDEDGHPIVEFDVERLQAIAARNNKRMAETGDLIPIVIGHTKDGADEEKQPQIVGYAKNLKVRPFRRTGKKAIHATFFIRKDKVSLARNFPRRSIELWLGDGKIDPISLLGATTPERDLGLLQLEKSGAVIKYAAGGKKKYSRLMTDATQETPLQPEGVSVDEKGIVAAVLKALEQSDVWQWVKDRMKEAEAGIEDEEAGVPPGESELEETGEEMPLDDLDGVDGVEGPDMAEGEEGIEDADGEEPVKYAASAPTGTNTANPVMGSHNHGQPKGKHVSGTLNNNVNHKGKAPQGPQNGLQKMARSNRDQLVRFQKSLRQVRAENEQLRLKFQRKEREADLMELAAAGYEFDPAEELDYVSQLPQDHYDYHLQRIKLRYQRSPVGEARFDLSMSRSPSTQGRGESRQNNAKAATELALRKGISYEQALEEIDGGESTY